MSPDQYCQQKAAASGSSFYYSFLFLPPERRRAITALYAFCREVDDAVDEASDAQRAAVKLAWWRAEVANLAAGNPQHPVTRALLPFTDVFSIRENLLNEIIDGMEMDLTQTRYLDWAGLERYCYRVAGVVGILAAGIFGYRDARTLDYGPDGRDAVERFRLVDAQGETLAQLEDARHIHYRLAPDGRTFQALVAAAWIAVALSGGADPGFRVSPWWLVASYLMQTIGELSLSPVGLSSMTKLAPGDVPVRVAKGPVSSTTPTRARSTRRRSTGRSSTVTASPPPLSSNVSLWPETVCSMRTVPLVLLDGGDEGLAEEAARRYPADAEAPG